tara:strand:- start:4207 stop:5547 length:1341 start_codon:yes stop_codon:yes gene_type:complete
LEFLGNEVINFRFSTDIQFYSCNIFYWKQRLLEFGINIPESINSVDEINFCNQYLLDKGFNSGPIFPIILYINRIIGFNNIPIRLFFIFLMMIYIFLGNKISILKIKNWKNLNSLLLLFSPILVWLTFFPSTDILFAVFWFLALYLFKKYIKRKELFKEKYKSIEQSYKYNKEFFNDIKYTIIFSIILISSILIRPVIFLCFMLLVFWLIYDLIYIWNGLKIKSINKLIILKSSSLYSAITLFLTFLVLFIIQFILYNNYAITQDKFHIFFLSFSPPAPIGLREALNNSLYKLEYLLPRFAENPFELFSNLVSFLFLSINHFIYGFLSIAGLQTNLPISIEGEFGLRNFAALLKSIYGIFILLPSIYIFFIKTALSIKKFFKKGLFQHFFESDNYYYFSTRIIVFFHILISIIMMPHVRYLVPILPILIETLIIKNRSTNRIKFNY